MIHSTGEDWRKTRCEQIIHNTKDAEGADPACADSPQHELGGTQRKEKCIDSLQHQDAPDSLYVEWMDDGDGCEDGKTCPKLDNHSKFWWPTKHWQLVLVPALAPLAVL